MRKVFDIILGSIGFGFFLLKSLSTFFLEKYQYTKYNRKISKIGRGVKFRGLSTLTGLENIEIEDNVHINANAYIRGEGGLFIGANTHIAKNLVIYTHNHNYKGSALPYDHTRLHKKVIIEKNVWIGINVTILPGTHIKEGAIIGAGSVVHGTVPPLAIYGASPGKVIKYRDAEHYNDLESKKAYGGASGNLFQN